MMVVVSRRAISTSPVQGLMISSGPPTSALTRVHSTRPLDNFALTRNAPTALYRMSDSGMVNAVALSWSNQVSLQAVHQEFVW